MKCSWCQKDKAETEFSWKKKNIKRLSHCKDCHSEYRKKHYQTHRARYIEMAKVKRRKQQHKIREFIWNYKLSHPCSCGESDPIVLEFDHLANKDKNIAEIQGWSLKRLEREINKCQVLCANCHRRKTAKQFGWHAAFLTKTLDN